MLHHTLKMKFWEKWQSGSRLSKHGIWLPGQKLAYFHFYKRWYLTTTYWYLTTGIWNLNFWILAKLKQCPFFMFKMNVTQYNASLILNICIIKKRYVMMYIICIRFTNYLFQEFIFISIQTFLGVHHFQRRNFLYQFQIIQNFLHNFWALELFNLW